MIFKTLRKDKILWEAVGTRRIIPWDTSKIRGWETKKLESVAPEIEVKPEASCFSRSQVKMNIKGEGTITESNAANR